MATFRIIYLPHGREDKEWIDVDANSKEEALAQFKGGPILSIR
jgi:hypothetical protein